MDNLNGFRGSKKLVEFYLEWVKDLPQSYFKGSSSCLAGLHGVGKTTVCTNILKKACQKNYTALYTNLNDIVTALTIAPSEDKFFAKKELVEVDFLVVDEFDARHMGASENALDLFGRTLEHVLRSRLQNKLPVIIISNSPNPVETFNGPIKQSLESLMAKLPLVPILGPDLRKDVS